jgi:hypothetical protein
MTDAQRQTTLSVARLSLSAIVVVTLAGCGIGDAAVATPQPGPALHGTAHGGQSPVSGAEIFVLAAGTSAYGGASSSLLTSGAGSTSLGYYVTSDVNGNYSIPNGTYSCTTGQQLYLLALGGNPGLGPGGTNPALAMMTVLGACPAAKTFYGSVVNINELTTIAAVYALAGYMTDATHVSTGGSTLAATGIANAFATAGNLVSLTGVAYATTPSTTHGTVPQNELNTLADLLQNCINSNGDSTTASPPAPCYSLFNDTNNGTRPTDTVQAALSIAHFPGKNVGTLFTLVPSIGAAFVPTISPAPNDWTVAITFTDANIGLQPVSVAVDGTGNVWTVAQDQNQVVKYTSLGAPAKTYTGFSLPSQVAIDSLGNAWVGNSTFYGPSLTNLGVTEVPVSGSASTNYTTGGINLPVGVAIDGSNDIWTANQVNGGGNISHITDAGAAFTTYPGPFGGTEEQGVQAIAIDSAGDIWTTTGYNVLNRVNGANGTLLATQSLSSNTLGTLAVDKSTNVWIADPNSGIVGYSNSTQGFLSGSPFTVGGVQNAGSIVLDGNANVWVTSYQPLTSGCTGQVSGITNAGVAITPSNGYTTPALSVQTAGCVYSMAIDGSGNIWYAGPDSMTEFIGAAVPVHTPISPSALSTKP